MLRNESELERARVDYPPSLPEILEAGIGALAVEERVGAAAVAGSDAIRSRFPHTFGRPTLSFVRGPGPRYVRPLRVGVVLSGGQAPGGHNVITGLFDALAGLSPEACLYGFLGGPRGIIEGRQEELTRDVLAPFRNTGGFDIIGSGRDKIETEQQLAASRETCEALKLDGLVVVGGDDSNTNAAVLAEYLSDRASATTVVGVPKTIDGDLKGQGIETSFGFDTATKVYAELIGNICRDAISARKYWHFIKLMGRNASHVTLECALQTHPNIALIGEEVRELGLTLDQVVDRIAGVVRQRAREGRGYGVCLVPEGLIEFVPEMQALIAALNAILASGDAEIETASDVKAKERLVRNRLSGEAAGVFDALPDRIRHQLLLDRDSHGNVQVSKIDTETLLVERVRRRIEVWSEAGEFPGRFQVQGHFFGYEGRCAAPTNFDADYTYALGRVAAALIAFERTGYLAAVGNLTAPPGEWTAAGIPLTSMMQIERRKGREVPVIAKALVRTDGEPFATFAAQRDTWAAGDHYSFPGAIQYFGPQEVCRRITRTLALERGAGH